jgi:hypothetical protein
MWVLIGHGTVESRSGITAVRRRFLARSDVVTGAASEQAKSGSKGKRMYLDYHLEKARGTGLFRHLVEEEFVLGIDIGDNASGQGLAELQ